MSGGRFDLESGSGPIYHSHIVHEESLSTAADDPERAMGLDWLKDPHAR
jgi:hypothetical protein